VSVSPERARLFVALDLPVMAREAIERWRPEATQEVRRLRVVGADALHATLCFLGWRSAGEIEQIGAACAAALGDLPMPQLSLGSAVWLPPRRPRVLAVRLEDPSGGLARVQGSLSAALSAGGWYAPEARPFLAHVTVARVPRGARVRAVSLARLPPLEFEGAGVTLYRSRLGQAGARYEPLRTVEPGHRPSGAGASLDPG
jgi:2'-5' RNA ligase